jgi:hypothetical protein
MNYFNLYASYPEQTIVAAWDSQLSQAAQTPWFKEIFCGVARNYFRALRLVMRSCAFCPAARGVRCNIRLRAPASQQLSFQSGCKAVEGVSSSIG